MAVMTNPYHSTLLSSLLNNQQCLTLQASAGYIWRWCGRHTYAGTSVAASWPHKRSHKGSAVPSLSMLVDGSAG